MARKRTPKGTTPTETLIPSPPSQEIMVQELDRRELAAASGSDQTHFRRRTGNIARSIPVSQGLVGHIPRLSNC